MEIPGFRPEDSIKVRGDKILRLCRRLIRDAAYGNEDDLFLINRWVYARLQQDERKEKDKIKAHLLEKSGARCSKCGCIGSLDLHRMNNRKSYSVGNCVLLCPDCHRDLSRGPTSTVSGPYLVKKSRRYPAGNWFSYWWDITPENKAALEAGERELRGVVFVEKDTGRKHVVGSQELLGLLTRRRQTRRKKRPWGIRILEGEPNRLRVEEPGMPRAEWVTVRTKELEN